MDAKKNIDTMINSSPLWQGELLSELRMLIHEADPDIVEEWKWDTAVFTHGKMVCAISGFKDHVKINFFNGYKLKDSKKVFNSGLDSKKHRGVDYFEGDNIDQSVITDFVKQAIKL